MIFCGRHEWMDLFVGKCMNMPESNFTMTQYHKRIRDAFFSNYPLYQIQKCSMYLI